MTDDRIAILETAKTYFAASGRLGRITSEEISQAQITLMELAALVRDGETRLQDIKSKKVRARRIRSLRLLLKCIGRVGFYVLRDAAMPISSSPYRLELRERNAKELAKKARRARAASEREWQTYRIVQLILTVVDSEGISQEVAFDRVSRQEGLNYTFQTFQDRKKELSTAARARGYADPLAPGLAALMGWRLADALPVPAVPVSRLTQVGRRRNKRGDC